MHKSGIALVLGLFTLIIGNISFALESQWKPFRSCIAMTTILDQYVKQGITPSQASDQVVRFHAPVSQSFLGTRDQESGILSIIKGAKDPQSLTINVDTSKIVSKFRLPQSWEGVHTAFYQDRLLLIVGYEQELSHLLIYSWDGKAFKPLKYFTFTGQLGTFEMMQDRLLLTTHQAVTQEGLQHIIQKHWDAPEAFPQVSAGIKYGLPMQPLFPASCQKIQHQLIPGNKHQWTILAHFALNALDKAPEIAYYLGNFEHLEVSQDYFFLLQAVGQQAIECKNCSWVATGAEQVSVLQRFAFEPKIHQQHSAVLTGLPTSGKSLLSQGNRIKVMTVLKSGKINQYELFDVDERFVLQAKRILMRNSQLWGLWRFVYPRLFVTNETQEVMGFDLDTSTSDSGIRLASAQVLLYGPALAKSMIQLEQKGSEIVIALLGIGNEKHHLQSYLLPQHRLIGKGIWDEERQILSFLTSYQGNSLIYGFEIKADGIRPLFARNYKKIWPISQIEQLQHLDKYSIILAGGIVDIFVRETPNVMKSLRIK